MSLVTADKIAICCAIQRIEHNMLHAMWVAEDRRCKLEICCPYNAKLSFASQFETTPRWWSA